MKFSLIMPTINRYSEIIIFMNSLSKQTYQNFELIIIDQNENSKIADICSSYPMETKIIKSKVKGLSINRNIGLKYVSGDIVAFPDDDCEYENNTLENVILFFNNNHKYDFCTCSTKEKNSELSILSNKSGDTDIKLNNVMYTGISFTIFVRAAIMSNFKFDEQLGVGAEFGSGEESDLLFFLLKNGRRGYYRSQFCIYHPFKHETTEKAYQYGRGYGAIHKKAVFYYKFYRYFFMFSTTLIKELLKIIFYKYSKERIHAMKGRIYGFCHYKYLRQEK